ncbi:MFS transporter [Brevibacillus laterosporus]|uniref:MFS transporter n=1 Tax=Brevibacillus laterosporus TaxID=1465 RepID=UPI0011293714|nr:MFS transporter [Brevibacillus laterosporus]MBG9800862.1 sugar phosphate permease [Brevibacillus laterosporus]MED4764332.1 MFS transporter [Brevibacillus laterosporus]TPH22711.1 MFS transporter [Brevibacillus laterosporus]
MATARHLLGNRTFLLLLVAALFMHIAIFLVTPIFPIFLEKARHLHASQIGFILAIASLMYQIGSLIGGFLCDRVSRKLVMISGAAIQACAMFGYSVSQTFLLFMLFSALNGSGMGLLAPAIKAKIADGVKQEDRTTAFSWRGIAANIGIIIGGLTVTLLALSTNRLVFIYAAGVYILLTFFLLFTLPKARQETTKKDSLSWSQYKRLLDHRSFLFFCLVSLLVWGLYAQFPLVVPLRGQHIMGTGAKVGLIWTINSTFVVLFQGVITRYILEKISPYWAMVSGTLFLGAGLFAMGFAHQFWTFSAAAVVFIIGEMLAVPVFDSLVGHFAKPPLLGAYYGIGNVVTGISGAIGNAVGGYMIESLGGIGSMRPWYMYGIITLISVAILTAFAIYANARHKKKGSSPSLQPKKERAR